MHPSNSNWNRERTLARSRRSLINIFLLVVLLCNEARSQTFIRSCNDPLILLHTNNLASGLAHTFCYHSCGFNLFVFNPIGQAVCRPDGICQCNWDCGVPPPATPFGDQCPPYMGIDPMDTNLLAEPRCRNDCTRICAGGAGLGQICGETYMTPIPTTFNTWAKICTCYCPPQVCVTPPTTTTTPTPATTTTTTAVVVVPVPNIVPALKFKKVLFKVFTLCWILMKLCALNLFLILFCCYFYMYHQWVNPVVRTVLDTIWNAAVWFAFR